MFYLMLRVNELIKKLFGLLKAVVFGSFMIDAIIPNYSPDKLEKV
jgi:hypothetical protein